MFTGIVETMGSLKEIKPNKKGKTFIIEANKLMDDLAIGDSVSVNGVCLTVTQIEAPCFHLDLVPETIKLSNLGELKIDSKVNLERALTLSKRLGGHMLQGHIETVGVIVDKVREGDGAELSVAIDPKFLKYCIPCSSKYFVSLV